MLLTVAFPRYVAFTVKVPGLTVTFVTVYVPLSRNTAVYSFPSTVTVTFSRMMLPIASCTTPVMLTLSPTTRLVVFKSMVIVAFCFWTLSIVAEALLAAYTLFSLYVTLTSSVSVVVDGIVTLTFPFVNVLLAMNVPSLNVTVMLPLLTGTPVSFVTVTSITTLPAVVFMILIDAFVGILSTVNDVAFELPFMTLSTPVYTTLTSY